MPPGIAQVKPHRRSIATSFSRRRRYFSRVRTGMVGSSRAVMAAFWMAMNWPESLLSFTSASAWTMRGWPQNQPRRQPIMSKPFDSEWISMPTSLAPGTARKDSGSSW